MKALAVLRGTRSGMRSLSWEVSSTWTASLWQGATIRGHDDWGTVVCGGRVCSKSAGEGS